MPQGPKFENKVTAPCGLYLDPPENAVVVSNEDWTPIKYPQAVWDDDEQRWISDAEVAEIPFT